MQVASRTKSFLRRTWETARRFAPRGPTLPSWEGKVLATVWVLAALSTLIVALAQSLQMFLLSSGAVLFGTLAALWMLNALARRR